MEYRSKSVDYWQEFASIGQSENGLGTVQERTQSAVNKDRQNGYGQLCVIATLARCMERGSCESTKVTEILLTN